MEFENTDTKKITFDHLKLTVTGDDSEEYGEWVQKTAKLLKRPFFAIHLIFEREKWTLDEIKRYYLNATKHNGMVPKDVAWWSARKKRNEK